MKVASAEGGRRPPSGPALSRVAEIVTTGIFTDCLGFSATGRQSCQRWNLSNLIWLYATKRGERRRSLAVR